MSVQDKGVAWPEVARLLGADAPPADTGAEATVAALMRAVRKARRAHERAECVLRALAQTCAFERFGWMRREGVFGFSDYRTPLVSVKDDALRADRERFADDAAAVLFFETVDAALAGGGSVAVSPPLALKWGGAAASGQAFAWATERDRVEGVLVYDVDAGGAAVPGEATALDPSVQFLANMSHEIRTPVAGILGLLDLMTGTPLNAEQSRYLTLTRQSATALLTILNDILTFSKAQAGRIVLEPALFDVEEVLFGAVRLFALEAQRKGLELCVFVAPGVPSALEADASRLRQLILNLVGNAVKFTEQGHVTVRVSVAGAAEESTRLMLEVRDTGIGISEAHQRIIFDAFAQADPSNARRFGGVGLGLAICAQLSAAMGGEIAVESTPGEGSVFRVGLPFSGAVHAETRPLKPQRVLIVGRCRCTVLLAATVRNFGLQPVLVDLVNAEADAVASGDFGAVFFDVSATKGGVVALAEWVKTGGAALRDRVVLVSTMLRESVDREAGAEAGVEFCLAKPLAPRDVYFALSRIAAGREGSSKALRRTLQPEPHGEDALMVTPTMDFDVALAEAAQPVRDPERLLVVEDNEVNRLVLETTLLQAGYAVELACDGQAAVEAYQRGRFDAIVMDLQMPVMSGVAATRAIRMIELKRSWLGPGHRLHTPILALSADVMGEVRTTYRDIGITRLLAKPVDRDTLLGELKAMLVEAAASDGMSLLH